MFNDDDARSALTNMYEYSPVDGFVEISQGLGDMIKSLANEPSMGLFYIQQHTHNAVPKLVSINKSIMTKSREMSLHTEDSEDSITMLRSMKESGFPIVDDMIKDITKSLAIMSSKQPKKGLLISSSKSFSGTTTNSGTGSYLSSAFKSAKLKATNLKWASVETTESSMEEELPVSSGSGSGNENEDKDELILNLSRSENFDEFKADKEAKLEEWLGGSDE